VLRVEGIATYYGTSQVLFGLSLEVRHGEVVALLGRNGMGKTTAVRSIMGLTPIRSGAITFDGYPLHTLPPYRIARRGLGLVPEGRQIFPNLSVRENLVATATRHQTTAAPWTLERIYDVFPALRTRQHHMGAQLSGGEQQMLAIGRALMTNPRLLILDEATEGLAPLLRAEIWRVLAHLKTAGQSIFLIDKHVTALMHLADRHYIIAKGQVV
jgi:branched-chain amino acid transport system ATP-binding protein